MANPPIPTTAERNAALGRLARNETVGLTNRRQLESYDFVEDLAVKRLVTQKLCTAATADFIYGAIIKLLEDARLTISLKAPNWFYHENTSKTYGNFWERGVSGASSDAKKRDAAENSMFGYSNPVTDADPKVKAAQNRLLTFGTSPSATFEPAMRPRYAAVDFAYCINGGLSKYGKSFLVLKDHMKHNSTFTHCDSFEVDMDLIGRKDEYFGTKLNLQDVACSYFQLGFIVLFCHPAVLKKLHAYATREAQKGSETNLLGGMIYIEAQMHADIQFSRDVAELNISGQDCSSGPVNHPKSKNFFGKKTVWDKDDIARVKKNAKKFAASNALIYNDVP
ncbi:DUF3626 domain-containing protein [Rhizobium sp. LjRoot30]|uniref:DUF3626 domain-containing protein n=1 Tax=Rhizobium sp. LjRoot30 TaxID=3342320 RepID=UPI003ECCAE16